MNFNSVNIEIGGKTRKLCATMANLYDMEADMGSIFSLVRKVSRGGTGLTITEMIKVIYYGLNGNQENRLLMPAIEKEVFAKGYIEFFPIVKDFLSVSLTGGDAQEKGASEPANQAENPKESTGNPITE